MEHFGEQPKKTQETREEHLKFCKDRSLEILKRGGKPGEAWTSFLSDMVKHPDTKEHVALSLGTMLIMGGNLSSTHEMEKFIEGFN